MLTALDYHAPVPAGWQSRAPSSSMRLAEYVVPGRDGGAGAEVVVYFFGAGQGGSVDANLARWRGQFSNPDGGPVAEKITRETSGAFPVTIAEWRGSYARGVGAGGAPRPDHMLVAAVVETPKGALFFQLFGPKGAVEPQVASYLSMVKALK